jgi:signal transduction histidine kinase
VAPGRRRATVVGDELRLRQVLTNLVVNAATHGASSDAVELTVDADRARVTIIVADHGPGIPATLQGTLFAPFAAAATPEVPGLGLGLYLAREIVSDHGGSLDVVPRTGGGTVATVQLPRTGTKSREAREARGTGPSFATERADRRTKAVR